MELMQLLPAVKDKDFYIVTEKNVASKDIVEKYRHHYLVQQERKSFSFLFKFAYNIIASLFFLVKENPNIIITTGAGASYPTCKFGKMLGKKVIYVESFAKLDNKSVTGEMVYPFADYFFCTVGRNEACLSKSNISWNSVLNCMYRLVLRNFRLIDLLRL